MLWFSRGRKTSGKGAYIGARDDDSAVALGIAGPGRDQHGSVRLVPSSDVLSHSCERKISANCEVSNAKPT